MKRLTEYTDEELVALAQRILAKYNGALTEAKEIAIEYGFEINEQENNILNIIFAKLKEKRDTVTKESVEPAFKAALMTLAQQGIFKEITELVTLFENQKYAEVKSKLLSMNMFTYKQQSIGNTEERDPKTAPKRLRVTLPDGRVICHNKVSQTLLDVVDYVGFERVERLGWSVSSQPFVSKERYPRNQNERSGWYVTTHSSTPVKKQQIEKLSDIFQLGLIIKII